MIASTRSIPKIVLIKILLISAGKGLLTNIMKAKSGSGMTSAIFKTVDNVFILPVDLLNRFYAYDPLNGNELREISFGYQPSYLMDLKGSHLMVAGGSNGHFSVYNYLSEVWSNYKYGSSDKLCLAEFASNLLLTGEVDGWVDKFTVSDGNVLGSNQVGMGNSINHLEKLGVSNTVAALYRQSSTQFVLFDGSVNTLDILGSVTQDDVIFALSPIFDESAYYLIDMHSKLFKYDAETNGLLEQVTYGTESSKQVREVTGLTWLLIVIGGVDPKIVAYSEDLSTVEFDVSLESEMTSQSTYFQIHETAPIITVATEIGTNIHRIYSLTEFCHPLCDGLCSLRMTSEAQNCDSCVAGYEIVNGECLIECHENEYRKIDQTCATCPSCCDSCSALPDNQVECILSNQEYAFENGSCVPQIPEPESETIIEPDNTPLEIKFKKISSAFEYSLSFNQGISEFYKDKQYSIELQNISEEEYQVVQTTKDQNTIQFQINFSESKTFYKGLFKLTLFENKSRPLADSNRFYSPGVYEDLITLNKETAFGLSEEAVQATKETTKFFMEFGSLISLVTPLLVGFLIPLQLLYVIALFPIQYPQGLINILNLLVTFEEQDFMKNIPKIHPKPSEELKTAKLFKPVNCQFSFTSIYYCSRLLRFVLRLVSTIGFMLIKIFEGKKKYVKKKTKKCGDIALSIFVDFFVSYGSINLTLDLLYMMTSLKTGTNIAEKLIIGVDFCIVSLTQIFISRIWNRYKSRQKTRVVNCLDRLIIEHGFFYQKKGMNIGFNFVQLVNFKAASKIVYLALLYNYPKILGSVVFFSSLLELFFGYKLINSCYLKVCKITIVTGVMEIVMFLLIGLLALKPQLVDNSDFEMIMVTTFLLWTLMNLLFCVLQFCESRRDRKKEETTKNPKVIMKNLRQRSNNHKYSKAFYSKFKKARSNLRSKFIPVRYGRREQEKEIRKRKGDLNNTGISKIKEKLRRKAKGKNQNCCGSVMDQKYKARQLNCYVEGIKLRKESKLKKRIKRMAKKLELSKRR